MEPVVTVVCLCYNQNQFVREAIESVFNQTHSSVQLIVIDDASTDGSAVTIQSVIEMHPEVAFIALTKNVGNCKAFNIALPLIKGEFVIDLAGDDILLPDRITEGVKTLRQAGPDYGVHFSDAEYISEKGEHLRFHSEKNPHSKIPQGDVYKEVIKKYFICSPTVMMRKAVLDKLNGYDEQLAYEDFDLWVRASRDFKFIYSPRVLVKKRLHDKSMFQFQFKRGSSQLKSTFKVCEKIFLLNKTKEEKQALTHRIFYEMKVCLKLVDLPLFTRYFHLLLKNIS